MSEQPALRDRLTFAITVVEAVARESRNGELPEWFRREWFDDELVPVLCEALNTLPAAVPRRTPEERT